jgi:hypothetical protein
MTLAWRDRDLGKQRPVSTMGEGSQYLDCCLREAAHPDLGQCEIQKGNIMHIVFTDLNWIVFASIVWFQSTIRLVVNTAVPLSCNGSKFKLTFASLRVSPLGSSWIE